MAGDITLGKLKLEADTEAIDKMKDKLGELKEGVPSVSKVIDDFVEKLKDIPGPAGAAIVGVAALGAAMVEMVSKSLEAQVALLELSEQIEMPIEKLQPFAQAMELSGVATEKLVGSLGKLSQSVSTALSEPTSKAAKQFQALGISAKQLEEDDPQQLLVAISNGLNEYAASATKTAVVRELLGKSGLQIMAGMKDEAEFAEMAAAAQKDYGTAVTEADAKSAKYFGATLKLGMSMFQGLGMSVEKNLLPALQELVNQFSESGKEGGLLHDILGGLGETMTFLGKVIIGALVFPLKTVAEAFKELGAVIGAVMAIAQDAIENKGAGIKGIFLNLQEDISKMQTSFANDMNSLADKLTGPTEAIIDFGEESDKATKKMPAFKSGVDAVAEAMAKLRVEIAAQKIANAAMAEGQDVGKKAMDDASIAAEALKLKLQQGTKAYNDFVIATKQLAGLKTVNTDEAKGWEIINSLVTENISLTTKQSTLTKALADIAADKGMTDAQRQQATALAQTNEGLRQQAQLTKDLDAIKNMVVADIQKEHASLVLTTTQMQLYNQQMALQKQYNKDIIDKTPEQINQISAAWGQAQQALNKNYDTLQQLNTSSSAFFAGAQKGMEQYIESATNMNTVGVQFENTLVNGITTAFTNMGSQGKKAWDTLAVSMLTYFEQLMVKMALAQAMSGISSLFGGNSGSGGVMSALTGSTAAITTATSAGTAQGTAMSAVITPAFTAIDTALSTSLDTVFTTATATMSTALAAAFTTGAAQIAAAAAGGSAGGSAAGIGSAVASASANGNAFAAGQVTAFADGGVLNGPTMTPMALMGEAGPEAVMPLSRNSQGQLGVNMSGQTATGHTYNNHINNISIHSNQDPKEIAKQVRKQNQMMASNTKMTIAKEQRSGGQLYQKSSAFNN